MGKKMKKVPLFFLLALLLSGCARSRYDMWEDAKTAKRHMSRGFKHMAGMQTDSRQIRNREDFMEDLCDEPDSFALYDMAPHSYPLIQERTIPLARDQPGEEGSSIPGIDAFVSPHSRRDLAAVFANIQFPYNSSLIKGRENLLAVRNISEYLIQHPHVSIFIEGHCDERGPQAYNLALGSRRANAVRNLLIKEGVNPNQVFTVSYGKERPVDMAHNEDAWARNRRGEFKVHQQQDMARR